MSPEMRPESFGTFEKISMGPMSYTVYDSITLVAFFLSFLPMKCLSV